MIKGELSIESDKTPRLKKKETITSREHSRSRAHAPASHQSLSMAAASRADFFENYRLHHELEAASRSVLKLFFRTLKMDASGEEPSNFSGSGKDELSLRCSSGGHQDADLRQTKARRMKHQTD